jgi:hypothetical protein
MWSAAVPGVRAYVDVLGHVCRVKFVDVRTGAGSPFAMTAGSLPPLQDRSRRIASCRPPIGGRRLPEASWSIALFAGR